MALTQLLCRVMLVSTALLLATCGGGGGGGSSSSSVVLPPSCVAVAQVAIGTTGTLSVTAPADTTISVSPLPLPSNAAFDGSSFTITPAPYQLGQVYELRWVANTDAGSSDPCMTSVTIVAGDSTSGTGLSGVVKASGSQLALANVRVNIPGTALETHTAVDGSFVLGNIPLTASVVEVHGSELIPAYAFVAEPLELLLSHTLYPGITNVIDRPIYIPELGAPGGIVDSGSSASSIITGQTSCGPVVLEVLAHSALLNGAPYNGPVYIPEVDRDQTPASLPTALAPGLVIAIQPAGIRFNPPARVTFPNCDHLPAGTHTDIWSINPNTGHFAVAGTGQVSADGMSVTTILGGVVAASWHMSLPVSVSPSGGEGDTSQHPACQDRKPAGSDAVLLSGALRTSHAIPSYWSMGQEQAVKLAYASDTAAPALVADAQVTIPIQSTIPQRLSTRLILGGADVGGYYTDTNGLNENVDEVLHLALQRSAENLLTGAHPYVLRVTNHFLGSDVSTDLASKAVVVNNSQSPYGAGWYPEGLESIVVQDDGSVLLLDGQGGGSLFGVPAPPGPGLVMQMFANATQAELQDKFSHRSPGAFSSVTAAGTTIVESAVVPTIDLYAGACMTSTNSGPYFYYRGPDGVISTTTPSVVNGDDAMFVSPGSVDIFGASFVGYMYLPEAGNLTLTCAVDNNFDMYIDGVLVQRVLGTCPVFQSFEVPDQSAGFHTFELYFLDYGLNATIVVQGSGCGLPGGTIPQGLFYTAIPGGAFTPSLEAPSGEFSTLERPEPNEFRHRTPTGEEKVLHPSVTNPSSFLLSATIDRNGNTWQYVHDSADRLVSQRDPLGLVTSFTYDGGGHLSTITDPMGRVTSFTVNPSGDLIRITSPDGSVERFEYSGHRMTAHVSKRGFRTTYAYDSFGRLQQTRWPDGTERRLISQVSQSTFDPISGLGTVEEPAPVVRPNALRATWTDAAGHPSTLAVNGFGQSLSATDELGRVTTVVRDADSLATQVTLPNGAVERSVYAAGNPTQVTQEGSNGSGPDDRTRRYTWGASFNQLLTVLDANGNVNPATGVTTKYEYDGAGNLIRMIDADNNTTQFAYDELGQGVSGLLGLLTSVIDPAGKRTRYFYHLASGNVGRIVDPTSRVTSFNYDAFGRPHVVRTEGNDAIAATDQATTYDFDVINQVLAVTDNIGAVTRTEYDADGNVTVVRDAKTPSGITRFAYDSVGRVLTKTDPLSHSDSYSYTPNGDPLAHVDRKGQTTIFSYDNARRLLRREFSGGGFTQYGYSVVDELTSVADSDSNLTFGYSAFGDLLTTSTAGSPLQPSIVITYTYDKNGNRLSMTPSTGGMVTYSPDKMDRLDAFTDTSAGASFDLHYDATSRRDFITRTIGSLTLRTDYAYDDAGNLRSLTNVNEGVTTPISRFQYELDSLGLRRRIIEDRFALGVVGAVHEYGYDSVSQLNDADHPTLPGLPDEAYSYDMVGNRETSAQTPGAAWSYNLANQLLSSGEFTYTYDANGNQETRRSTASGFSEDVFTYNTDDQMVRLDMGDGRTFEYAYDGLGRRIRILSSSTVSTLESSFVYDEEDILFECSGSTQIRYTHGPGIDEPLVGRIGSAAPHSLLANGLGSITESVDSVGTTSGAWSYGAFGFRTAHVAGPIDRYGFAAREADASGLAYLRHRYYDVDTGRFVQEDPLGLSVGPNLYTYVGSKPTHYTDPFGLRPLTECEKRRLGPYVPKVDLENADLHDGEVPDWLNPDADAVTLGNDIYIRPDVYDPTTPAGLALLGHELIHVGQYRAGMTYLDYIWESLFNGWKLGNKYENPAYEMQGNIAEELQAAVGGDCRCSQ